LKAAIRREGRLSRNSPEARAFWRAVGVLAVFNLLLVAWVLLQPAGPRVSPIVSNIGGFVGPLLVLPLCFGGLRWARGASRAGDRGTETTPRRWPATLLGIGILTYALGQVAFTWYVLALNRPPPMPSFATIGFLGQYPFLLLGILLLPARATPVASRTRGALDGL